MGVDPRLDFLLARGPVVSYADLQPDQLRARANQGLTTRLAEHATAGPPLQQVTDHVVPVGGTEIGAQDGAEITVRIYRPDRAGPLPAHVYYHGGGFWMGTLDHFDAYCRYLAAGAGCLVASVDYRLAPEHPYPTPLEDCYDALTWLVAEAGALNVDTNRISVGGASAGGNLAAAVALLARDRGGPELVLQVLEIPVLDFTMSSPSIAEYAGVTGTSKEAMATYRRYYVAGGDPTDRYVSPLLAPDLDRLPAAFVMTAEFDPLRDEGEAYAGRLSDAGVATEVHRRLGQIHGSHVLDRLLPDEVQDYRRLLIDALRRAYGDRPEPAQTSSQ